MPVRISCPNCKGPCLVSEQNLGTPVHCPHCRQPFIGASLSPLSAGARGVGGEGGPLRLDVGDATTIGRVRKRNEDSYLVHHLAWSGVDGLREIVLLALADGMGGYEGGHLASRLTIQTVASTLAPLLTGGADGAVQGQQTPSQVQDVLLKGLGWREHYQ